MGTETPPNDHHGPILDSPDGYAVIDCRYCGFKHLLPIPDATAVEQLYDNEERPQYLERHPIDLDWWNLVYDERYQEFEELLPTTRRQIVDVGSGPGFFLQRGRERGWQTLGVEPTASAVAHSRELGLEIIQEFFTPELAARMEPVDVVHLSYVLEHIPDPISLVRAAYDLLTPGGLLCIVVPNDYNQFQRALRIACDYEPWWLAPPYHINYFDYASLGGLMERCGFTLESRAATFPIDMFLLMGDNYVGNDQLGRACHAKRKLLDHNLSKAGFSQLKRQLGQAIAPLGIGRELVFIGRKR